MATSSTGSPQPPVFGDSGLEKQVGQSLHSPLFSRKKSVQANIAQIRAPKKPCKRTSKNPVQRSMLELYSNICAKIAEIHGKRLKALVQQICSKIRAKNLCKWFPQIKFANWNAQTLVRTRNCVALLQVGSHNRWCKHASVGHSQVVLSLINLVARGSDTDKGGPKLDRKVMM